MPITPALVPPDSELPVPQTGQSPASYADELGRWYADRIDDHHRKRHGHYLTPSPVARFMGDLASRGHSTSVRILDPAAGAGVLAASACEALALSPSRPGRIELVLYEIDPDLAPVLEACVSHLRKWLGRKGIRLKPRLHVCDFLLANAGALEANLFPHDDLFDAVICNPPYFKLQRTDPRAQACLPVVHGQPNVYGLFMALGAAVLRPGGRLVFITPRSFASGPYFQRFRAWFLDRVQISDLHVFESRTEAFDAVLQETVITAGTRCERSANATLRLSVSNGSTDIDRRRVRTLPLDEVVRGSDRTHRIIHLPTDERDDRVRRVVSGWSGSLRKFGLNVSTGPVVAFRAKAFLRHEQSADTVPLLWLQHVKSMAAQWPLTTRKPEHIEDGPSSQHLLVPNRNYVLLRRFTAKEEARRLVAAPYLAKGCATGRIGLENHLNYIHRPQGTLDAEEVVGLAAVLNSRLLDAYIRVSSGNTQVSATELRALPLPSHALITRIGRRIMDDPTSFEAIVAGELDDAG